jgi:hypothetical protein
MYFNILIDIVPGVTAPCAACIAAGFPGCDP